MKKVTIMIPTYNQSQYIEQAIQSAQQIKYENLEIIVSDDNSTDDTEEVVSKFLDDERIKYFKNEPNLGRVANYRKTLYEYATGDYVLNLDGDDWLEETEFIPLAVKLMVENENISCVFGDRTNYNEQTDSYQLFSNAKKSFVQTVMDGNEFFIKLPEIGFHFGHLSCLYKRDLAIKMNFYSLDILSADSESIAKLYINNKIGYIPLSVGVWREHDENASHKNLVAKLENIEKYNVLYEYALENSDFDKNRLLKWKMDNQSATLAQDILYYTNRKKIKFANKIIVVSFRKSIIFGFHVLLKVFIRGISKL